MRAMEDFSNNGMIPEQIWDSADIPERELFLGRPSGSAMPLVWAHAEYVKLRRSLREGRIFDTPQATIERYLIAKTDTMYAAWRFNQKMRSMPPGKDLRIEALAPAMVRWTADDWQTWKDAQSSPTGLGVHLVDLPTRGLPSGSVVTFTFRWPEVDRWEGRNFSVRVE